MTKSSTFAKGALAAAAGLLALGAAGDAPQAQPYGGPGYGYYYDPCQREAEQPRHRPARCSAAAPARWSARSWPPAATAPTARCWAA